MSERISEAEHEVMKCSGPSRRSAPLRWRDAVDPALAGSDRTVKTMLSRLLAKGAIAHHEEGRRYLYRPAVSREAFVARESVRLLDRMFGGRVTPLVAHLAEQKRLSPADIAEIEALLKALKS
jgi:predicted transcriptional regulator